MNDPDIARVAAAEMRRLLAESPELAPELTPAGGPLPLGFAIRSHRDAIQARIARLEGTGVRAPGFQRSPGEVRRDPRTDREIERLRSQATVLWRLSLLARSREENDPNVRAAVRELAVQEVRRRLRGAPGLRARWVFSRPGPSEDWPHGRIMVDADVRVAVPVLRRRIPRRFREAMAGDSALGSLTQGIGELALSGGLPRFDFRQEWRRELLTLLYIDWREQTISTRAPRREPERDVWYWIGKVSEGVLLAVDVITLAGLARRVVIGLAGRIARTAAARTSLARSVAHELDELDAVAAAMARRREASGLRAAGRAPGASSVEDVAGTAAPAARRAIGNPATSRRGLESPASPQTSRTAPPRAGAVPDGLDPAFAARLEAEHPALPRYFRDRPRLSHDEDTVQEVAQMFRSTRRTEGTYVHIRAASQELKLLERLLGHPHAAEVRALRPGRTRGDRTPDFWVRRSRGEQFYVEVTTPTLAKVSQRSPARVGTPATGQRVHPVTGRQRPPADKTRPAKRSQIRSAFARKIKRGQVSDANPGVIVVSVLRRPKSGPVLTARQIANLERKIANKPYIRELLVQVPGPGGSRLLRVGRRDSGLGLADGVLTPP